MRVSLRTVTLNVPPQDVITRDNVPARVDAVVYFRVVDPTASVVEHRGRLQGDLADRPDDAALRAGQGGPRHAAVRARAPQRGPAADHRRADRAVGHQGHDGRDQGRRASPTMQRAMARQAEAERERRAKVIHAEGEFQASPRARPRPRTSSRATRRRCSCATCRRSPSSGTTDSTSSSRCRSTSCGRSWATGASRRAPSVRRGRRLPRRRPRRRRSARPPSGSRRRSRSRIRAERAGNRRSAVGRSVLGEDDHAVARRGVKTSDFGGLTMTP